LSGGGVLGLAGHVLRGQSLGKSGKDEDGRWRIEDGQRLSRVCFVPSSILHPPSSCSFSLFQLL
jgi:hypothetical protein